MVSVETRRELIADRIRRSGEMDYATLAASLDVSEMTIRRDIELLETRGLVRRVLGGAIAFGGKSEEPSFASRMLAAADEKTHIARAALGLLVPHETVILDSGSSVLALARQIRGQELGLTVVTPSVFVAMELADEPATRVFMTGGRVRAGEMSMVGAEAEATFERYNCDTYVMGVAGVDARRGVTDYHDEESAVKIAAMHAADRVIVAVDASKLGRVQLVNIAPLERIHSLITDGPADHPTLQAARDLGVEVICVPSD